MLHMLPRGLPPFGELWEATGKPHPTSLAKAMHVDVRTVYRWMAADLAPRPVSLLMWCMSSHGRATIHNDMIQRVHLAEASHAAALRELQGLRHALQMTQQMAQHHARTGRAANEQQAPLLEPVRRLAPVVPGPSLR